MSSKHSDEEDADPKVNLRWSPSQTLFDDSIDIRHLRKIRKHRRSFSAANSINLHSRLLLELWIFRQSRRICPGMHLAERTQWQAIAKILWAFDIELAVDPATGQKIVPDPEAFKEGIAHGPKPFKVVFRPRSQAHIDTILREAEQSLDEVAKWD